MDALMANRLSPSHVCDSTDDLTALLLWDGEVSYRSTGGIQTVRWISNAVMHCLSLPSTAARVYRKILWGDFNSFYTPAFWKTQVWFRELQGSARFAMGRDLLEEAAACLLGGFGFRAELGHAAFERIRDQGLLLPGIAESDLERSLAVPLQIGGRAIRYRFPRQKARYLHALIAAFNAGNASSLNDLELRRWLMKIPGIGYKTASWILRNARASDRVAILDVHVIRACQNLGLFDAGLRVEKDYETMEALFLHFAHALEVSPALLDLTMWEVMRLESAAAFPSRNSQKRNKKSDPPPSMHARHHRVEQ
jgi:thermostable 8-oxoguanine DNA glycosylase